MFRSLPIFQRLLSWSKPDAPCEAGTREYEWYDHNSLIADEPENRALVPRFMDRAYMVHVPSGDGAGSGRVCRPSGFARTLRVPLGIDEAGGRRSAHPRHQRR